MATKTVFVDIDNNEMDCFINDQGKVYIGIQKPDEGVFGTGYITLDKEDVSQLIKMLTEFEKEM